MKKIIDHPHCLFALQGLHMQLGLSTVIIMFLQVVLAFFRPHAAQTGERKANLRIIWEFKHHLCT